VPSAHRKLEMFCGSRSRSSALKRAARAASSSEDGERPRVASDHKALATCAPRRQRQAAEVEIPSLRAEGASRGRRRDARAAGGTPCPTMSWTTRTHCVSSRSSASAVSLPHTPLEPLHSFASLRPTNPPYFMRALPPRVHTALRKTAELRVATGPTYRWRAVATFTWLNLLARFSTRRARSTSDRWAMISLFCCIASDIVPPVLPSSGRDATRRRTAGPPLSQQPLRTGWPSFQPRSCPILCPAPASRAQVLSTPSFQPRSCPILCPAPASRAQVLSTPSFQPRSCPILCPAPASRAQVLSTPSFQPFLCPKIWPACAPCEYFDSNG